MGLGNWLKSKGKNSKEYAKKNVNYEEIQETMVEIKDMAQTVLSPKKAIQNARRENFQEAKERLNITDAELIRNYKNFALIVYISLFFSVGCFLGAIYNLFFLKSILPALSMISIMLLCLANAFKFSFRAFQIRHQKLYSVKEWWERANEWIPKI